MMSCMGHTSSESRDQRDWMMDSGYLGCRCRFQNVFTVRGKILQPLFSKQRGFADLFNRASYLVKMKLNWIGHLDFWLLYDKKTKAHMYPLSLSLWSWVDKWTWGSCEVGSSLTTDHPVYPAGMTEHSWDLGLGDDVVECAFFFFFFLWLEGVLQPGLY